MRQATVRALKPVALCLLLSSLVAVSGVSASAQTDGARVVFRATGGPDYIDPGLTYYSFGFMLTYAVNRPLYSYSPAVPDHRLPDVAEGEPVISADNKTVTVRIKSGIRFSPPVNREVTSRDVKYAIERAFTKRVPSGYAFAYFRDLDGAPKESGPLTDIAGIQTPDDRTVVFNLKTASAATFAAALVLPITVPVPKEYARPFDRKAPSDYDDHVVFTGPYMIKNDAEGNLVGLGDDIEIVRNPNWDPGTDFRPAYLDEITIRTGGNLEQMAMHTLEGSHLMCCDTSWIGGLSRLRSSYPEQIASVSAHGTRWVALNTTVAPLTNLNVRKALVAVMDRKALRRARGGPLAGWLAEHFIPPGVPGFEESGGYGGIDGLDYMQHPTGDRLLAKKYMLRARRDGVPVTRHGTYAGHERLLMVASDYEMSPVVARGVKRDVERLGFDIDLRLVPTDEMYVKWCGVPKARVAICPNVGWFADFLDPQSMLEPTFNGDAIRRQWEVNWSLLDDAEINDAMAEASLILAGPKRSAAWGHINRMIVEKAPGIPYLWDTNYQLESSDVGGVVNPYYQLWDLSFTAVKP